MKSVVDFHSHILPGVDDGSRTVENSLAMLSAEAEQGINKVVLTPHFYADHDSPERFFNRRSESAAKLREAMVSCSDLPEISLGAEVHYFEGISDSEYLEGMVIEGTKCVLIEMPMRRWNERMLLELASIRPKRQITPIIAHIDRYITPLRLHSIPENISRYPLLVQANASFFIRHSTRRLALKLLSQGKIHLLGSDCHDLEKRPPNLRRAIDIIEHGAGEALIGNINSIENDIMTV